LGDQWHYSRSGQQAGPVTGAQLKQLAARGEISPTDLVWKDGLKDWVPASKLRGLFPDTDALRRATPPLPAPSRQSPVVTEVHSSTQSVPVEPPHDLLLIAGIHPQRIAIAAAALVGMSVAFCPWSVTHSVESTGGWLHTALCTPALVMSAIGRRSQPVVGLQRLIAVVPAMVPIALAVRLMGQVYWHVQDVNSYKESALNWTRGLAGMGVEPTLGEVSFTIGWGVYLAIGASAAMLFAAWHLAKFRATVTPTPAH
jgi:hypothetical protein